ncbi:MAG: hypothetical protein V1824_04320 [archaeon]
MNVNLRGVADKTLELMVELGYANTKSEAIRLAIVSFGKEKLSEDELVNKKLDWIDEQVRLGKRKLLTADEAFGKYAKLIKSNNVTNQSKRSSRQ